MKEGAVPHHRPKLGIGSLEKDVAGIFLTFPEEDDHQKARDGSEPLKPFASFGSFRQRHGNAYECDHVRTIEAPARLESSAGSHRGGLSESLAMEGNVPPDDAMATVADCGPVASKPLHPLHKLRHKGKSCSTDLDREEAWERKREQYLLEEEDDKYENDEEYDADEGFSDALSDHASDDVSSGESDDGGGACGDNTDKGTDKRTVGQCPVDDAGYVMEGHTHATDHNSMRKVAGRLQNFRRKPFPRLSTKPLRTKSLTDEDLEELRGSIDLGFGFSYNEQCKLKSTLPALELYYAINKNYVDAQSRSSPNSPLEGNALLRTNSSGSTSSLTNESWRISSPGDHPSQVKTRLRHWAQVVAFSVKQGY